MPVQSYEFRWANTEGAFGLPHPDELEYLGYEFVKASTLYPTSRLYRREVPLRLSDSGRYGGVHPSPSLDVPTRRPVDQRMGDEDEEE
jgi:hypothetical protein